MAGAIAGTAILNCSRTGVLQTVTLTINNHCNLSCPHCYLQYRGPEGVVGDYILSIVYNSQFKHLAIVGKEPLADLRSRALCANIAGNCARRGKSVSLITNGLTLGSIESELLHSLAYLDVSFDGGPDTYQRYRGGSLKTLANGLACLRHHGYLPVNALHVLSDRTVSSIDDMMRVTDFFEFRHIMFSPYVQTASHGVNTVSVLPLEEIFQGLAASAAFMDNRRAFLLLDGLHIDRQMSGLGRLDRLAARYGLLAKLRVFPEDTLLYGLIRITYDGLVLRPQQSLHTDAYAREGMPVAAAEAEPPRLEDVYKEFLAEYVARQHQN